MRARALVFSRPLARTLNARPIRRLAGEPPLPEPSFDSTSSSTARAAQAWRTFLKAVSYQVVRQFALLANIDLRVRMAQNNVISIKVFFDCDLQLAREYMAERHPGVNFSLKRVEP